MKRQTTRRGPTTWRRTAASVLASCLFFTSAGRAQEGPPALPPLPGQQDIVIPARMPSGPPLDGPPIQNAGPALVNSDPFSDLLLLQGQRPRDKDRISEGTSFSVPLEFPGPEAIFRRESEGEWRERIRQEAMAERQRVTFPEEVPVSTEPFKRRQFPPMVRGVEPNYVCHGRLFFEQKNFERAGWDLGVLNPVVSLGIYYYDLATLPYHFMTRPFEQTDCSAGKCLPGDPTPLYLYRGEFSVTGLVGEAAVVTGLFYLFP